MRVITALNKMTCLYDKMLIRATAAHEMDLTNRREAQVVG
jgi:hypothetical protein